MKNSLKEIATGFNSLLTGMRITLGQFFKPIVTVQYPHESLKMPERFRGHIELVRDPETGKAICFACKLCERACPSDCITVEGAKLDGAKKKSVTQYVLDFTKCSLCGSCVEACRDGAIRYLARVQPGQHEQGRLHHGPLQAPGGRGLDGRTAPSRVHSRAGVLACEFSRGVPPAC